MSRRRWNGNKRPRSEPTVQRLDLRQRDPEEVNVSPYALG